MFFFSFRELYVICDGCIEVVDEFNKISYIC